jgi:hypothetical protein
MKKNKILYPLLGLALLFTACTPNTYELAGLQNKSALSYTIAASSQNANDIVLTSLTPNASPMWITPYIRSYNLKDTVNLPFPGTYKLIYGAELAGGLVTDTANVVITTTDPNLAKKIHNPMWTNLTGGLGNAKTWYLDLNASGVSKYWTGPQYYYGTNDSWLSVTDGVKVGGDSWNWNPDYPGNTWLMAAVDFGSMTFNLKQGFNAIVDHTSTANGVKMGGNQSGTYALDTINHTIELTNVSLIHPIEYNGKVKTWSGTFKLFSLTANSMQIAVMRDPTLSGEGACYYVYNFVSKDYYDSH